MNLVCEICGDTGEIYDGHLGPGYIGICCWEHTKYLCTACYHELGGTGQEACPINGEQINLLMVTNLQAIEQSLR